MFTRERGIICSSVHNINSPTNRCSRIKNGAACDLAPIGEKRPTERETEEKKGPRPVPYTFPRARSFFFFNAIHFFPHQEACSQANNERVILTVWRKYCGETTQKKLSHGGIYLVWRTTKRRIGGWIILPLSLHNVRVCGRNSMVWTLKWNLFSSTFTLMVLFITNFWVNFLYEILWCDHSNETSSAVL